jgi:uncharacterized protein (TIGR02246 family)
MFRLARVMIGAAGLVALAACAETEAPAMSGTPEDEAAIRAQVTAYANAYSTKDAAALAAITTEDYESVGPDGSRMSGRAAVQEMVAAEMAMMPADMAISVTATTDYLRWLSADAAVAGGTWSSTGAPAGMGPDRGAWMSVFVRDTDGQWRMSNGMSAPYMPPPPAATTP